jgi:hypothetical protein
MKILNTLFADIFYDNNQSGLKAQTIKQALDELNVVKPNLDVLTGTLQLFATDTVSDIVGFNAAVTSTAEQGFSFNPVNIVTAPITEEEQLVGQLITGPGVLLGTVSNILITTIANIKRISTDTNQKANFFFRVFY